MHVLRLFPDHSDYSTFHKFGLMTKHILLSMQNVLKTYTVEDSYISSDFVFSSGLAGTNVGLNPFRMKQRQQLFETNKQPVFYIPLIPIGSVVKE